MKPKHPRRTTPLTTEEKQIYLKAQAGDQAAITEILHKNRGLVHRMAYRYARPENDLEELVQVGQIGMLRAIELFDVNRGFQFSTYATCWLRQAIGRFVCSSDRVIHVPAAKAFKTQIPVASLDALMDDGSQSFGDGMEGEPVDMDADMNRQDQGQLIDWALGRMPLRLARIIRLRHGIGGGTPKSLRRIAHIMGISAERVRQLERRAFKRLRLILRRCELGLPSKSERIPFEDCPIPSAEFFELLRAA